MSEKTYTAGLTPTSKLKRTNKYEIKRELQFYNSAQGDLKETLAEKDLLVKSQRNTIQLYEKKIENLENNNNLLKDIIGILSKHITEELNDSLPPLPMLPEDPSRLGPIISHKKHHQKSNSTDLNSVMNTISQSQKLKTQSISSKKFIFDPSLQSNLYQNFHESEFLKSILDSQLCRAEMQKVIKFLLGKTSQDLFLFKTRTILFETLSFYLSLRNVAFLNSPEIFLPRALEMLMDILEVEKITVLIYDKDVLSSIAVTAELPQAITVNRVFGHFSQVHEPLLINSASDDPRFDKQYDQICNFVTHNLACVQISLEGKALGILECCNKQGDFTLEDAGLMTHIAHQLAIGQVGLDLKDSLSSLHQKPAINRGSIESCREVLMMTTVNSLAEALVDLVNCERVTIYLYSPSSKELISVFATGIEGVIRIPSDEGIAGLAFSMNSLVNADSTHPSFCQDVDKKTGFVTKEILAMPIGEIGVVQCLNKKHLAKFSKIDEKRLEMVGKALKCLIESVNSLGGVLTTADVNEVCIQSVRDGILHVNHQGVIQKINVQAAAMLKTRPEKVVGANINEALENYLDLLHTFWECAKKKENNYERTVKINDSKALVKFLFVSGLEENPSYLIFIQLD